MKNEKMIVKVYQDRETGKKELTNTWFEFENVPTNMGYLDIYKIEKI